MIVSAIICICICIWLHVHICATYREDSDTFSSIVGGGNVRLTSRVTR